MPNKRGQNSADQEISWRTEELGPEMRRRLFEKLIPSGDPARRRDGPAAPGKDPQHSERPNGPRASA
jgi:hypothetical protein